MVANLFGVVKRYGKWNYIKPNGKMLNEEW